MREKLLKLYRLLFAHVWATKLNYFVFDCALRGLGVMNHETETASGEHFLITGFLPKTLRAEPVLFDVGANIGNYSAALIAQFPKATILAFEPNPRAFEKLKARLNNKVECLNLALSESPGELDLYDRADAHGSEHASVYSEVISQIHHTTARRTAITATTLDILSEQRGIDHIDFLKIDTEGHELSVIRGAFRMINEDRIGTIQIEFNEMNLMSRTFCRDLKLCFPRHSFYRLLPTGLLPIPNKALHSELFGFQNLVGLRART